MPTIKPAAKPKFVGDSVYNQQAAQLRKAYADYVASQNTDKTNYNAQYALNNRNLGTAKKQAFGGLEEDFASRGIIHSGVYGKAFGDMQTDYTGKQTQLDTDRQSFLNTLRTNLTNFRGDQNVTLTSAQQEAIARRAARAGRV